MGITPFFDAVIEGDRESGRRILRRLIVDCEGAADPSNSICDETLAALWLNLGASGKIQMLLSAAEQPVPMVLTCPACGERHIDVGEFATKAHHTHACQGCGIVWRPAIVPTVGVQFLPGFKDSN